MKINGIECQSLINLGAEMSTITITFAKQLDLPTQQLDQILNIETTGGTVPYFGYIKVNLQVPGVQAYNEDVLMLVLEDIDYSYWVPIQFRTLHPD